MPDLKLPDWNELTDDLRAKFCYEAELYCEASIAGDCANHLYNIFKEQVSEFWFEWNDTRRKEYAGAYLFEVSQ